MEFFNIQNLLDYKNFSQTTYSENNVAAVTFKETRDKLRHFVSEFVNPTLNTKLLETYSTKPNKQAGQGKPFKHSSYVLTGVNLNKKLGNEIFLKFEFGNLLEKPNFNLNLDINFSSSKPKVFKGNRDEIYANTYVEFPLDENFPSDYQGLIDLIKPELELLYKKLLNYNFMIYNVKMLDLLQFKKQIILQGPPGTGKTRKAVQLAKALTGIEDDIALEESGQLKIVQFHPSYSYEDFVEGLKPKTRKDGQITFVTEDGVFKEFCKTALVSALVNSESNSNENSFDYIFEQYIKELRDKPNPIFLSKNNVELILDSISDTSITVKYKYSNNEKNAPGVRPFIVSKDKLRIVTEENINPQKVKNLKAEIKPLVGHIAGPLFAVYTHFYNFMQTLTIDVDEVQTEDYDYQSALDEFKQLHAKGEANFEKKYVLIIDEMNRANLSTVLGELISLMEDGKRLGASEQMTLELPTSKEEFGIPKNLYIIGTMNTADRSVSHIDYAVRRRFAFVNVFPDNLTSELGDSFDGKLFEAVKRLFVKNDNEPSEFLSAEFNPKDVQLGHSYFIIKEKEGGSMALRLEYEIKPILMEYVKDGILRESAVVEIEALSC